MGPKTHAAEVTFYEDALPILQSHCQGCHHPGEGTPMSLLNYEEVRPWAKAIREKVRERRREGEGKFERRQLLTRYAPGGIPNRLEAGQARLIPAGSDFIFELH